MGLANPKSQSFNFPVDEINKFSGLISRWIMSRAWHQATAFINLKTDYPLILRIKPYFVTWCAYERTIICDTPPGLSSNTSNMFLSTNSKTKKSFLFRLKNSSNWTMFSWRKLRKTRSSLFTELKTTLTDCGRLQQGFSDGTTHVDTRWCNILTVINTKSASNIQSFPHSGSFNIIVVFRVLEFFNSDNFPSF